MKLELEEETVQILVDTLRRRLAAEKDNADYWQSKSDGLMASMERDREEMGDLREKIENMMVANNELRAALNQERLNNIDWQDVLDAVRQDYGTDFSLSRIKIPLIKEVRNRYMVVLKEAKDAVDLVWNDGTLDREFNKYMGYNI